ncbi:MAG: SDR family NAD(P)-dependent oxidoreductase [Methylococcales bacterium]|nr:SDR family NAD(P)-dependent oxidoreductase [Methylococcales bacterium]
MKLGKKRIVITGSTSGIGYEMVKYLHPSNEIIRISRSADKLNELKQEFIGISTYQADLSKLDDTEKIAFTIVERFKSGLLMKRNNIFAKCISLFCIILSVAILTGCASTAHNPQDPWEKWNRSTHNFNDNVDDYILRPVAEGYDYVTPDFVSTGVSNFFSNLNDIEVTINDLLQLKFIQGGMDASRFLVNTSAGIGGLIDVASMINLPKHDEDFGQTLGYWGVPSGPYLVLPFLGPSSPRGTFGLVGDSVMNPLNYLVMSGSLSTVASLFEVVETVDARADLMNVEKELEKELTEGAIDAAIDQYAFFRDLYLQHRRYLIYDGEVPEDKQYDTDVDIDFDEDVEELEGAESSPIL